MIRWSTPRWWYRRAAPPPIARAVLSPLSRIWADRTADRIRSASPVDPGVPVICVGNLTAGGSGKTPVVMELTRLLQAGGKRVVVLSSGYGGKLRGPVSVDPTHHDARAVSDEALMMTRAAPVMVSRDRVSGARLAVAEGAEAIVMDDGHQNPALVKALSIVTVDGETRDGEWPFGGGGVIPAGPLREPLEVGLARADAIAVILPVGVTTIAPELRAIFGARQVWIARWVADGLPPSGPQLGFAGVAKPWRVERTLRAAGCDLVAFEAFPDHAPITKAAIRKLARHAAKADAGLITTGKDWVRLPPEWRERVTAFKVRVRFDDEGAVRDALSVAISR